MYGYKKELNIAFDEAVEKTREELAKEGFSILTEANITAAFKKKLNIDYDNYHILGACNPPFAYKVLQVEKDIGLLLPCNVIVYEDSGRVFVSAILPTVAMSVVDNAALADIAEEVEQKLKKVVDQL